MAVYKYDELSKKMVDIATQYKNVSADKDKQPPCCPHGSFSAEADCHAKSIVSGDFDGDLLADQIVLYGTKMEFYFSTDRSPGVLPIDPSYIGAVINIPCFAESFRLIDLNNDGIEEIFVMCRQAATFLVYTKGETKSDWTLDNGCNHRNALGDIVDYSLGSFTVEDIVEMCNSDDKNDWLRLADVCKEWEEQNTLPAFNTAGISTVDLNNDGFIDAVVTYDMGYIRFFHNVPSKDARTNE
jgi:hypothetical protein